MAGLCKSFSGIIEITDWHGNLEKAVIYKNGIHLKGAKQGDFYPILMP